ncbi:MAG TPA: hypothetical protein PJ990_16640, partial [Saprospiraceae bacterium]|nr:hypothetical protein [Saprospiraceae bacterium]
MKKSFLKPTLILFNILLVSLITDTTLYAQEARPAGQGINFNCSNEYGIFEDNEDIAALLHQLYLAKGGCESEYVHEMIDKLTFFYITNRESVEEDILNQVIQLIIALDINNVLISSYNETIESLILQYLSIDNPLFSIAVAQEIVRLMILNPEWPMVWVVSTAFMNVMVEGVHVILDGVGLIPGAGEIFDVINGTLYAIEGDWTSAAFSFGATVPFLGWFSTTAKFATRPIAGRKFLLVWKKSADGTKVLFASDNALR